MKAQKHDRQEAIQRATQLFWEKGFHATSMRNIQDYIDLRPGSIYASFGSKEGLFNETLQFYAQSSLDRLSGYAQTMPALDALKAFVMDVVCRKAGESPSDMCMLAKTVAELTEDNADLLKEAKAHLMRIEQAFAELLERAQQEGTVDKSKDPAHLASFLQVQIMGLRAYARASGHKTPLQGFVDEAFAGLH